MTFTILLWSGLILVVVAAGLIVAAVKRFLPRTSSLHKTLGFLPLAALSLGGTTALFALVLGLWVDHGEHHTVRLQPVKGQATTCAYTWPTGSARAQQTLTCPHDVDADGADRVAVRLPGTDHITVLDDDAAHQSGDPYSAPTQGAALLLFFGGGVGAAVNSTRSSRRTGDLEMARLARWSRDAARPSAGDDLTWEDIAERSERPDAHGGPLVHPERHTGIPDTGAILTMQYPYSYVRVMTKEPAERSVLLLFVNDDAWRLDVDGLPARAGTATVSRVLDAPGDLHVTIDGYTYDIADDPTFLPAPSLESLRRQSSMWLMTPPAAPSSPTGTS